MWCGSLGVHYYNLLADLLCHKKHIQVNTALNSVYQQENINIEKLQIDLHIGCTKFKR